MCEVRVQSSNVYVMETGMTANLYNRCGASSQFKPLIQTAFMLLCFLIHSISVRETQINNFSLNHTDSLGFGLMLALVSY